MALFPGILDNTNAERIYWLFTLCALGQLWHFVPDKALLK